MAILRSTDGKFYNIPDENLGEYEMSPDDVKQHVGSGGPGYGPGPGGPGGGPGPQGGGYGPEVTPQSGCWRNCWRNCWSRNCWRNCY